VCVCIKHDISMVKIHKLHFAATGNVDIHYLASLDPQLYR